MDFGDNDHSIEGDQHTPNISGIWLFVELVLPRASWIYNLFLLFSFICVMVYLNWNWQSLFLFSLHSHDRVFPFCPQVSIFFFYFSVCVCMFSFSSSFFPFSISTIPNSVDVCSFFSCFCVFEVLWWELEGIHKWKRERERERKSGKVDSAAELREPNKWARQRILRKSK